MGPATTVEPEGRGRVDTEADVVLGGGDGGRVGQIPTGTHRGADRGAEVVRSQDLGDAGRIPVTRLLHPQLQQIEAHRLGARRNLRDGRVRRWGDPHPGIDPDWIHVVALTYRDDRRPMAHPTQALRCCQPPMKS